SELFGPNSVPCPLAPTRSIHEPSRNLFIHREKTHPQELREAGERAQRSVPAGDAARVVHAFLQASVGAEQRRSEGLQAAFSSIFPISSHSGNARLEFVSYSLG